MLELLCVGALVLIASWNDDRVRVGHWIVPATVIGVALVLQANLLRWLGPPGDLNALDVARMNWPTLVSLLWASIGAALTIWARRVGSRVQWSAGAAFLVGAAIKLLLLDFGSLGELANILAVIAAGGVFLLVGWLAPMPPARRETAAAAGTARRQARPPRLQRPVDSALASVRAEEREHDACPASRLTWTVAVAAHRADHGVSHCRSRCATDAHHRVVGGGTAGRLRSSSRRRPPLLGRRSGRECRRGANPPSRRRKPAAMSAARWVSRLPSNTRCTW